MLPVPLIISRVWHPPAHDETISTSTYHNFLDIVLVGLPQLGADLRLGPAHVLDLGGRDGDGPLDVEGVDVADGRHGDLRPGLFHDLLDCGAPFADDATDEIVVCQNPGCRK